MKPVNKRAESRSSGDLSPVRKTQKTQATQQKQLVAPIHRTLPQKTTNVLSDESEWLTMRLYARLGTVI